MSYDLLELGGGFFELESDDKIAICHMILKRIGLRAKIVKQIALIAND